MRCVPPRSTIREMISARTYSKSAGKDVKRAMHRKTKGKRKRSKGGKGGKVKSRKQAIAIGLSEARKKGKKSPRRRNRRKRRNPDRIEAGSYLNPPE
jgi:hypothetical protein